MPHFRNFHSTTFLADTVNANKANDVIMDAETITADKYDDFVDLGTGNDTINARGGDDQTHFNDDLTILAQEGTDTLLLKAGIDADTINANEPLDQLFDPNNFGETPPLDMAYEIVEAAKDRADSFFDIEYDM